MNRISTRTLSILSVLSLAVVMTVSGMGLTANAQDKLSKSELNTLIATAKTPAEHQRIAQYYTAQSQDFLAQANEHEAMLASYKANPSLLNEKFKASTIKHCENLAADLKDLSVKSQEMAKMHEQMATEGGPQK